MKHEEKKSAELTKVIKVVKMREADFCITRYISIEQKKRAVHIHVHRKQKQSKNNREN